jgi:hypothetical protein
MMTCYFELRNAHKHLKILTVLLGGAMAPASPLSSATDDVRAARTCTYAGVRRIVHLFFSRSQSIVGGRGSAAADSGTCTCHDMSRGARRIDCTRGKYTSCMWLCERPVRMGWDRENMGSDVWCTLRSVDQGEIGLWSRDRCTYVRQMLLRRAVVFPRHISLHGPCMPPS